MPPAVHTDSGTRPRGTAVEAWGGMEIIRIISIVDTREYEEQGDRWVPIPGSGDRSVCARCQREHEVHATVELADGSAVVVGTGCAARDAVNLAAEFKRGDSRAKKIAAQRAKVARMEVLDAELAAVRAEVARLAAPEVTVVAKSDRLLEYVCGETKVWRPVPSEYKRENERRAEDEGNRADAVRYWRERQVGALGITSAHHTAANWVRREREKLAKMEREAS